MEDTKKRLGRGLSALLGDVPPPSGTPPLPVERVPTHVPIEKLSRNPANPRSVFHDEPLDELARSIAERGVMQPLLVRPVENGYQIIAGERRWRAAQKAGLHQVPVVVRDVSPAEALELAIIENVQRADLNAVEEAMGYQQLINEFGHRQEDLAKIIGKSRSHVANTLRLLGLPASIRASVAEGSLSAGHARALIGTKNPEEIADQVIAQGLSVRATEALVSRLATDPEPQAPIGRVRETADTRALVRRLSTRLGLNVSLNQKDEESGTLTIRYSSVEQLDAVCRLLGES